MAQCRAHRKSGVQCKNGAIPGGTVCRYHGGSAPQVKAKARERILALVEPAIAQYTPLLKSKHHPTRLNAVKDILDRAGYKPVEQTQELPYDEGEVEQLSNLSDEEIRQFIELKRKMKT